MATATYTPIATQTLGSAAASITFSSIPGTYTDLRLVLTAVSVTYPDNPSLQFNTDTGTNYSEIALEGNGTSATSVGRTSRNEIFMAEYGTSITIPQMYTADIFSYAGGTNKQVLTSGAEDENGGGAVTLTCSLWRSTAAITSIKIFQSGGNNFATGSIATLWGI